MFTSQISYCYKTHNNIKFSGDANSTINDGTLATFHCREGQFIVRSFEETLHETNLLATDTNKKPIHIALQNIASNMEKKIEDYAVQSGREISQKQNKIADTRLNMTLVVPAKMTLSAADFVCRNGIWMRIHGTEETSTLPTCFSEHDVGTWFMLNN